MTAGLMSSLTGMPAGQIIIVDGQKPRKQIKGSLRKESGEDAGRRWKMKITLDVRDTTVCAYFNYMIYDNTQYFMHCSMLDGSVFYDGNEIKIQIEQMEEGEE